MTIEPRPEGFGRLELARPGAWAAAGACVGQDPALWYPTQGVASDEAERICRGCPVREECLEFALANHEPFGIWGGLSQRDRRPLIRARYGPGRPASVMEDTTVLEDPPLVDEGDGDSAGIARHGDSAGIARRAS